MLNWIKQFEFGYLGMDYQTAVTGLTYSGLAQKDLKITLIFV